ncbi:MAG TPA: TrkA family potassium uptake protein [Candidatus Baltobacteraceae bacterium]|nr:TrkA family potassium uptake protein [Candidatus Baltobacteraceae bacterium]
MFILIVGGGKVGSYLTRALLNQHHEVVVVEKIERKAKTLDTLVDRQVTVVGDGCDPTVLEAAGVARADVVVADTGDDEDNLVVVLLTKKKSKARCIARVNNPSNKQIFDSLDGADPVTVISSTEIILDVLNEHVNAASYSAALETMHLFGRGNLSLVRISVPEGSVAADHSLADLSLPRNSVIVAIERESDDSIVIPTGETQLHAGDRIVAVCKNGAAEKLQAVFTRHLSAK